MIEAIAANRRRSTALILALGLILVLTGFLLGRMGGPGGGFLGVAGAAALFLILWGVAAWAGDRIVLATAGAQKIEKSDAPQLFNIVEEMTIASGLGRMPDVYLIPDDSPNAFAAGRRAETRVVAVTSGLLRMMNRDELQGVIAHEMGHHKNADVKFMILAGVMLGAIVILAEVALRGGALRGYRRSSSRDSGGQAIILLIAVLFMILAPILARLLYFACSRRREYLADASAARFTRYPEGLASALEKISGHYTSRRAANKVLAPLYIVNPMEALAAMGLFSTHPPVGKRVEVLRNMGGRAAFAAYEEAYRSAVGGACIGKRSLAEDTPVEARAAEAAPETHEDAVRRSHEASSLAARKSHFVELACPCGVTIRYPEGLKRDSIPCPRCGRENRTAAG